MTHTSHARTEHSAPCGDASRCMGVGGRKCPAFQSGTLVSALPLIGRVAPGQPPLLLSLCSVMHILNPSRPVANSGSRRQTWPFPVPCSLLDPVPALFASGELGMSEPGTELRVTQPVARGDGGHRYQDPLPTELKAPRSVFSETNPSLLLWPCLWVVV